MALPTASCVEFLATGMHLTGKENCVICTKQTVKKSLKANSNVFVPNKSEANPEEKKPEEKKAEETNAPVERKQLKKLNKGAPSFVARETAQEGFEQIDENPQSIDDQDFESDPRHPLNFSDDEEDDDEEEKIFFLMQQFENCECCEGDIYHCSGKVCEKMGSCFCHSMTKDWGYYIYPGYKRLELKENWRLRIYYPGSKDCKECQGWIYSPEIKEICINCIYERCRVSEAQLEDLKKEAIQDLHIAGVRYEIIGDTNNISKLEIKAKPYESNLKINYSEECACKKQHIRKKPAMEICNCFYDFIKHCEKNCKSCKGCSCSEETKMNEDHCNFCKDKKERRAKTFASLLFMNPRFAYEEKCDCCNGFVYSCANNDPSKICAKLECCFCLKRLELDDKLDDDN